MKSVITPYFKTVLVQSYINSLLSGNESLYLVFSQGDIPVIGIRVPRKNIVHGVKLHKLGGSTGIVPYDKDIPDLHEKKFFGFTDTLYDTSVYKLLSGTGTTVPSEKIPGRIETSDGSSWKYMYTVDPVEYQKFTLPIQSEYYLPVKQIPGNVYNPDISNKPPSGHGVDTPVELFATSIILSCTIPGKLFKPSLEYTSVSLCLLRSDIDVINFQYRLTPKPTYTGLLKPGDTLDITEPGFKTELRVLQVLSDNSCIVDGDRELLDELYTRNSYRFSKGEFVLVRPSVDEYQEITFTPGSVKTVEYPTSKKIVTVVDF